MVHNGIEYGLMAAYAEGFDVLRDANVGTHAHDVDAETTPLRDPEHYAYDFDLREIAELWRRGSVISSWLLDLYRGRARRGSGARRLLGPRLGFRRGALDDQGRDRRGRAHAGARDGAVPALQLARSVGLPGQAALGDALPVRRAPREAGAEVSGPVSDALVFFGATGDLAYKKIFPALLRDGEARHARRAGDRRRARGLDARAAARAREGEHREARRLRAGSASRSSRA